MKKFDIEPSRALSMEQFLKEISQIEAPRFSDDYIAQSARLLKEFANNENIIWDYLNPSILEKWEETFAAPQSFVMGFSDDVTIRANIWVPSKVGSFTIHEDELYAYGLAHNHDFRLLTVGFYGPGYETDLYRFEDERKEIPEGEAVELKDHRRERLTKGSVWLYEQYSDVHIQRGPSDLSISINIIYRNEEKERDQILFDVEKSRTIGPVRYSLNSRLITAMEMADQLGNRQTMPLLENLKQSHGFDRVKAMAAKTLASMQRVSSDLADG